MALMKSVDGELVPMAPEEEAAFLASRPGPDLTAAAKAARYRKETGGILVAGVPVATDDRSKLMIMGARTRAEADPTLVEQWDTGSAVVPLTAAQLIAISDAVAAHVSACFATYKAVKADIDAGVIASTDQIDARFA